MVMLLF